MTLLALVAVQGGLGLSEEHIILEHQFLDTALHTFLIKLFKLRVKLILLAARNEQCVVKDRVLMPSCTSTTTTDEETSFGVFY